MATNQVNKELRVNGRSIQYVGLKIRYNSGDVTLITNKGEEFYISSEELLKILRQRNYVGIKKITRYWLKAVL